MKIYTAIMIFIIFNSAVSAYSEIIAPADSSEASDTTEINEGFQEEELLEGNQTGDENSATLDYLENLRKNPVDLNTATLTELESVPFVSSVIAQKIIQYRTKTRYFKTKRSLLKVEGFTEDYYQKIKNYFIVKKIPENGMAAETDKSKSQNKGLLFEGFSGRIKSVFIQDLQLREGYISRKYEGTKPKIYNRINMNLSKTGYSAEANITVEKDAGEKNLTDFVSGYIQIRRFKFVNNFIAGDYSLNFAQGLALWSSSSFSKGIDAVSPVKKRGKFADGYSSADESRFFRGAAAEIKINKFRLNLFYSNNFTDATADTALHQITGIYYDGYHRTSSEIKRINSLSEKFAGARVNFDNGNFKIGSTYWQSVFSGSIAGDSKKILYDFTGKKADMISADYDFIYRNINFFGEAARSQSGSAASINSMQLTFINFADILFSYRSYPKDFAPLHSSGFGERSGETRNEKGFYAGISLKPFKGLYLNGYFDQFKFPYRTYFEQASVSGNDFLANAEWRAAKGLILNLKYKNENREESRSMTDGYGRDAKRIDERRQTNARAGMIYNLGADFRFRSVFEYVDIEYKNSGGGSRGSMFYSDVRIIPANGLTLDLRYIIFETKDYESRIYEYENDIEGLMSNVPLFGKGRRVYIVFKYRPVSFLQISGKYSETFSDGIKSSGSGNDKIGGDINNRFSACIEIKF